MNGLVLPPDLRPGRVSAGTFPVVSAVPPSTDATDGSAAVPPQESGRPKGRIQAGKGGKKRSEDPGRKTGEGAKKEREKSPVFRLKDFNSEFENDKDGCCKVKSLNLSLEEFVSVFHDFSCVSKNFLHN